MADTQMGFLQLLFDDSDGYLALGCRVARSGAWQEHCFHWLRDNDEIAKWINVRVGAMDMYYCPTLLARPKKLKGNVTTSKFLWADLDNCQPEMLLVPPTIVIATSRDRHQALWRLDHDYHAVDVEAYNKRIAYAHKDQGCDTSGWDLTQFLRLPGTNNFKYGSDVHHVAIVKYNKDNVYELKDFDIYPAAAGTTTNYSPMPQPSQGDADAQEILDLIRSAANPRMWKILDDEPLTDWSKELYQLEQMLFTAGLKPEEAFVVCKVAACNKFRRDNKDLSVADDLLWKDVCRAWDVFDNQSIAMNIEGGTEQWFVPDQPILTEEQRRICAQRRTIIEEYIEWAKTVGDAAPQYHEAGAFMILSTLLSGSLRLYTSFGAVIPNLWFMILADTTLTRKTTAMDLAIDMIADIDSDAILATDGSIEGLMNSMSFRPSRASIFLRDEFSGLLDAVAKKDYYSGMLETLTKLYDGRLQKRVLKKEIITVRDPVLLIFAGGIKDRIYSLLTVEHINSGFVPRFCFITAESDITRLKPLGPPTEGTVQGREYILQRLRDIYNHYTDPPVKDVGEDQLDMANVKRRAELTERAWMLYNDFDAKMIQIGLDSSVPELLTPVMARLCISGLKASVLLAAAEALSPANIEVTEHHILQAFYYVERWKAHALNVVANAGKTATEKQLERIYVYIQEYPGCTRSSVMQRFRLMAREMDGIQATLQQRGLIRIQKAKGKGEVLFPIHSTRSAKNVV